MKKIPCPRCRHPEAHRFLAFDGRPMYGCTKCKYKWSEGYPDSKRRRKWYELTRGSNDS